MKSVYNNKKLYICRMEVMRRVLIKIIRGKVTDKFNKVLSKVKRNKKEQKKGIRVFNLVTLNSVIESNNK